MKEFVSNEWEIHGKIYLLLKGFRTNETWKMVKNHIVNWFTHFINRFTSLKIELWVGMNNNMIGSKNELIHLHPNFISHIHIMLSFSPSPSLSLSLSLYLSIYLSIYLYVMFLTNKTREKEGCRKVVTK